MTTAAQERQNRHRRHHPEAQANRQRRNRYGLEPEDYAALLDRQDGRCALCGNSQNASLYVDHDHVTGEVRGLLCASCNKSLGTFCDDPEFLRLAATYVEQT